MANNQTNMPWTIMDGVRGVPQPPVQLPSLPDLGSYNFRYPFPPDITNGRYLAMPNPQPQPSGTASGLNVPAQPLSPGIYAPFQGTNQNAQPPAPTLEQIAMSPPFNFSNQSLAATRSAAESQVGLQDGIRNAAALAADRYLPKAGPLAGHAVSNAIDAANGTADLTDQQRVDKIYNDMLQKQLNDAMLMQTNNAQLPQGDWNR